MVCRFKFMLSCTLIATSIYSMESEKEEALDTISSCNLATIREKISREHLAQHAPEFFDAVMHCENTHAILEEFNTIISPNPSLARQTFGHLVNKHLSNKNTRSFTGNPYLDTLIKHGKLK